MTRIPVDPQSAIYEAAVRGLQQGIYYAWFAVHRRHDAQLFQLTPKDVQERCRYLAEAICAEPTLLTDFSTVVEVVDQKIRGLEIVTGLRGAQS